MSDPIKPRDLLRLHPLDRLPWPKYRVVYNPTGYAWGARAVHAQADTFDGQGALAVVEHYRTLPGTDGGVIEVLIGPENPRSAHGTIVGVVARWRWSADSNWPLDTEGERAPW